MPEGSGLESVIVGAALIVSGMLAVAVAPLPVSNTENAGVKLPETVGVPPRVPFAAIDIPVGRFVADQEAVPERPVAVRDVPGYGRFRVETGRLAVVILGTMVSVKLLVSDNGLAELSVTVTLKVETEDTPAGPDKTPPLDSVSPDGGGPLVTAHVYGRVPPVAANEKE
jgi:hypothetical protein